MIRVESLRVLDRLKLGFVAAIATLLCIVISTTPALADVGFDGWEPDFTKQVLADYLREGYWLEDPDVNGDGRPDLVAHGLSVGELYWYDSADNWSRHLMQDKIPMPVGAHYADLNGNGFDDYIFCYDLYGDGGRIDDPKVDGGKIAWLKNPDPSTTDNRWEQRYIGEEPGMHRLRVGHFTNVDKWQVLALPIVSVSGVQGILNIPLYTAPDDLDSAESWDFEIIDDLNFRMLHGAQMKSGINPTNSNLDSVVLASDEGVTYYYFDDREGIKQWTRVLLGTGDNTVFHETEFNFKGSGNADIGKIGTDPFGYGAAVEPFHGSTLAVYYHEGDTAGDPGSVTWQRRVLEVYGSIDANGEGPGHHVYAADFDGDGDDEFVTAVRGPAPHRGVFYYKAIDVSKGLFLKWQITDESAARVVVDDFDGDGDLDFATVGYSVDKYYEDEDPKLLLFTNNRPVEEAGTQCGCSSS